jgi:hypothetical protein
MVMAGSVQPGRCHACSYGAIMHHLKGEGDVFVNAVHSCTESARALYGRGLRLLRLGLFTKVALVQCK